MHRYRDKCAPLAVVCKVTMWFCLKIGEVGVVCHHMVWIEAVNYHLVSTPIPM